ncbi:MAG: hypothetical protein LBC99_08030 [Spirochaetota bacterium]|nr:hypothetical protein [Spirochaetota bacterium]
MNLDAKAGPASEYSIRIFAVGATEAGWESRDFTVTFISDYGHLSGDQKRLVITDDGRISGIFSATFDNMEVYTEGLPGQASGWILQRGVIRLQLTREEEEVDPEITDTLEAKMDPYPKGYSWEPPQQVNAYKFRQDPKLFRVGSANIEIFGTTKQKRYNTHTVLASMATNFDILAIQEVGSNGNPTEATATTVMNNYVARVNELAPPELGVYSYVRHHQYAFVYRKDIVVATAAQSYNDMPGATHQFTYPPLVAKFTSRSGLDFALMTVHTSPDKAKAEIMYIPDALNELKTVYEVQRVGCLGDYNGDGSYYTAGSKAQGWLNGFPADTWFTTVPNGPSATWTTTVASGNQYVYDRFQLSHSAAWHFTGRWGVLYYADYYDISICEGTANNAGKVDTLSDHYPIWAEFSLDTQTPPP